MPISENSVHPQFSFTVDPFLRWEFTKVTLCMGLQATNWSPTSSLRKTTATQGAETRTDFSMGKELSSSVTEVTWRFVEHTEAIFFKNSEKDFHGLSWTEEKQRSWKSINDNLRAQHSHEYTYSMNHYVLTLSKTSVQLEDRLTDNIDIDDILLRCGGIFRILDQSC